MPRCRRDSDDAGTGGIGESRDAMMLKQFQQSIASLGAGEAHFRLGHADEQQQFHSAGGQFKLLDIRRGRQNK